MKIPSLRQAAVHGFLWKTLLPLLLLCVSRHLCLAEQPQPLTSAHRVHNLSSALASHHLPVHLVATVTYYDPSENTLFVADDSGSVYIATSHPYALHRGDRVRVDGTTHASFRTVVSKDPAIQVIGTAAYGQFRRPGLRSYGDLMAAAWDGQYVSVRGRVRSALVEDHGKGRYLEVELLMPGGLVQAYVQDFRGLDPRKLIDADLELSGVIGGEFNAQWQLMRTLLYATDRTDVRILRGAKIRPEGIPLTPIPHVMQTRSILDQSQRVRVRGTVTAYQPGRSIVIQQDGQSLYSFTRQAAPISLGAVVDLVGFADEGGYGPALGQAEVLPLGKQNPVQPIAVSYAEGISGAYSDNLVSLRGSILSQLHTDASDTLTLMVDNHPVTVVLQASGKETRLPTLPVGTWVAVTGICRVTPTGVWSTPGTGAMLFRVDLRTRDDLSILHWPSWWNLAHVLILFGALFAVSLLITVWAIVLRSRIAQQTARIGDAMHLEQERSRLLEAINSEISLSELLKDICTSFEQLAPGLACCCSLKESSDPGGNDDVDGSTCFGEPPAIVLLEVSLTDPQGRQIGRYRAGRSRPGTLSEPEIELIHVAAGLANLSINQRRLYRELNYTSTHDQLTSLPNRRSADNSLDTALGEALANGWQVGVAYIDVDRFKQVNDQYGHKIGDLYLQHIAARLSSALRPSDQLARIGGDEFLLIAPMLAGKSDLETCREWLEGCFGLPFVLEGICFQGSASIGIAVFPDHGTNAEDLKRHADIDMYAAKHRGRLKCEQPPSSSDKCDLFSPSDLRQALREDRFMLYYQPQFSSSGELKGLEALLRLNDPILGVMAPDTFIDVAESNDLIVPLGKWVLRRALADAMHWHLDRVPGARVIVNVSARELDNPDYAREVLYALELAQLPPDRLEIEITERVAMRDLLTANQQIKNLHGRGVHVAVDDFGTEYSCLNTLHKLSVDTLKIDRSFMRARSDSPEVLHVIEAIVSLAHLLGKRIVVEGVETAEDLDVLAPMGDIDLQGFFFSRPQPAEVISAQLQAWRVGLRAAPDGSCTVHPPVLSQAGEL